MKRVISSLFIFLAFSAISPNAFAAIGLVSGDQSSKSGTSSSAQPTVKPCPVRGYKKMSCPTGEVAQNFCPEDNKYFSSCACDLNYYKYSIQNCDINKQELSGTTCLSGDVKLYKNCKCKSVFKFCKEGYFHSSASCTDEEGAKYAICNEDIPSCESIGHLSSPPAGYSCQEVSNEYMKCYISSTCTKN